MGLAQPGLDVMTVQYESEVTTASAAINVGADGDGVNVGAIRLVPMNSIAVVMLKVVGYESDE